jgi:hypothetical protein
MGMNETVGPALKILVERAVRPVRALRRRRMKMREELLAHVSAVFEEEYARCGQEAGALEQTRRRFGEPAQLTSSLQESVPQYERMAAILQAHLCKKPGETSLHFALRHAWLAAAYMSGAGLLGFLLVVLILLATPGGENRWLALLWLGVIIPIPGALGAIVVLLWHGMWQALHGSTRRSYVRTAMILLASASVGPVVLVAISMQATEDLLGAVEMARPSIPVMAVIPPFVFVFMIDLIRRTTAGSAGRSILYTIAVDSCLAAVLSLVMFGIALIITADTAVSLEHAKVMAGIVLTWLLPLDLVVSMPSVVTRLRDDRAWAELKLD